MLMIAYVLAYSTPGPWSPYLTPLFFVALADFALCAAELVTGAIAFVFTLTALDRAGY